MKGGAKSSPFLVEIRKAYQVSKMDWSVIIRGARPSAARDRPSEAREFARGVRGHSPGKF